MADARLNDSTVVLLHGLNRTQLSMAPLALALRRRGHHVSNRYYHSRAATIEQHADCLLERLRRDAGTASQAGPVHFVAHSMGCLVVRAALARCAPDALPLARPGRFVMIAPPNRGSELAARLSGRRVWDVMLGRRALQQLAQAQLAEAYGSPPLPFGVIAGGRGDGRGWNPLLPGDDDGVVTVAGTHLPGEADHVVLRALHTTLPWRRETARHVQHFLDTGRFDRMRS
jgi:pimeloyl-ACP methyl ester carboxylesterase